MANKKIKGITIEIGADTLGLDKALKGVEQSSKKASDELREVNKTIKTAGDSAVLWQQKQKLRMQGGCWGRLRSFRRYT